MLGLFEVGISCSELVVHVSDFVQGSGFGLLGAQKGSVGVGQLGAEALDVGVQFFVSLSFSVGGVDGPIVVLLPEFGLGA